MNKTIKTILVSLAALNTLTFGIATIIGHVKHTNLEKAAVEEGERLTRKITITVKRNPEHIYEYWLTRVSKSPCRDRHNPFNPFNKYDYREVKSCLRIEGDFEQRLVPGKSWKEPVPHSERRAYKKVFDKYWPADSLSDEERLVEAAYQNIANEEFMTSNGHSPWIRRGASREEIDAFIANPKPSVSRKARVISYQMTALVWLNFYIFTLIKVLIILSAINKTLDGHGYSALFIGLLLFNLTMMMQPTVQTGCWTIITPSGASCR